MSDLAVAASPRELIPGDPDGVEAVARRFDTYADGATEAAARLRDIDAGAWVGEAANAFRGAIGDIPEKLERGSRAFSEAGSALFDYARALRDAQAKAVQALEGFREAETATSAWSSQVDRYESDLKSTEAAGTPPPFGPPPPSVDPGAAGRSQATSLLEEARADVEEAAERAAARLEEAGDQAPDEPGLLSKAWDQISEFGKGVGEATYGLLEFGFKLSPTYALINPEGYVENLEALGKGLAYGVTHPVEFGKAVLDWETWKENPARALGRLVPDLVLAVTTAGAGAAAVRGIRAARATQRLARMTDEVADTGTMAKRVAEPARAGGAYRDVPANGGQVHHMPADAISPVSTGKGPGVRMETNDHMATKSWGSSRAAKAYRGEQRELIEAGKFKEAQQRDIADIRDNFGSKYDDGIAQMEAYTDSPEFAKILEESLKQRASAR